MNLSIAKQKEQAIFMAFSSMSYGHEFYRSVCESIPRVPGYKREKKRAELAFDIVRNLEKKGYVVNKVK
jgi:hypothetical protein